ncbi:MAG: hypothetical protein H6870_14300 [Methylobacteriaceae bacterium]|nr:hypothetical protein [Methylobacteriaceae bacterium]
MTDKSTTSNDAPDAGHASPSQTPQQTLQAVLRSPAPRFYANGIGMAITASDMKVIFLDNGAPMAFVSMSYNTAKSLALDLQSNIKKYEEKTGQKVIGINEAAAKLHEK